VILQVLEPVVGFLKGGAQSLLTQLERLQLHPAILRLLAGFVQRAEATGEAAGVACCL
jgi:hypothetical protein